MSKIFIAALEQIAIEQGDPSVARLKEQFFEESLPTASMKAEFEHYCSHYEDLTSVVASFESIEEVIVNTDVDNEKINFHAIADIINTIQDSVTDIGDDSLDLSTEGWRNGKVDKTKQRELSLEHLGTMIKKIWEAIKKFLLGVWNWIKELFNWQRVKKDRLEKKADVISEELKETERDTSKFEYEVREVIRDKQGEKPTKADLKQAANNFSSNKKRARRFDSRMVSKKGLQDLGDMVKSGELKVTEFATESEDSSGDFIESIFTTINTIQGNGICYNSQKARYLMSAEKAQEISKKSEAIDIDEASSYIDNTYKVMKSYVDFVKGFYLDKLKEAIKLLSKDSLDQEAANKLIQEIFPDESKLKYAVASKSSQNENVSFDVDSIVYFKELYFTSLSNRQEFFSAVEKGSAIGGYLEKVKFFTGTPEPLSASPLITLTPNVSNKDVVDFLNKQSKELFDLFSSTTEFSARYQNVLDGFNKATQRIYRNEERTDMKEVMIFTRAVLHAMNVYVNQPFVCINDLLPKMIDAILDYSDCYLVCKDPSAYVSIL